MSKFVHLAREFFTETDMRSLLSATNYFTITRLYEIARDRGILLSDTLTREQIVNELSRLSYSYRQLQDILKHINKDEKEEDKSAVLRVENKLDYSEIIKAKELLASKREQSRREAYSVKKITNTKTQIIVKYIDPDFTQAKGFQRQERTCIIEVDANKDRAEIMFGKDDRSSEIAYQFVSALRSGRKDPNELIEKAVELSAFTKASERTQFFLDLIETVEGSIVEKVKDVRLEKFKPKAVEPLEDEEEEELTPEEIAERQKLEKQAVGTLQSAVLHGENILQNEFYLKLSEQGYFISFLRWEIRERGGDERRVVLEAGFTDAQKGKWFYFDAKKIYGKDELGNDRAAAKNTKVLDRARFRRIIADAAFKVIEKMNQHKT